MHSTLKRIVRKLDDCDLYLSFTQALGRSSSGSRRSEEGCPVTILTSSGAREGKTFVALSLALQAAGSGGRRTLLVDSGRPGRHSSTRVLTPPEPSGPAGPEGDGGPAPDPVRSTGFERLDLLPSRLRDGRRAGTGYREDLARTIQQLRSRYELVIVDGMSLAEGPGAYDLLRCADGALFVIEHRRFSVAQIRSYLSRLERLDIRIIGAVLNKRKYPIPSIVYNWF